MYLTGKCDVHGVVVEWDWPGPPQFDGKAMNAFCHRTVVVPDPCIVGATIARECRGVLTVVEVRT